MAKKKKIRETTIENYYDLKVDKVDELVAALKEENYEPAGEISMNISDCTGVDDPLNKTRFGKQKQFDPYKTDFLGRVPTWIKAIFIKFWFAGAVCYFIMWGIGLENGLDSIVLSGAVLGIVVDILINPLFRYMESDRREYDAYMMFPFPFKAFWTFFANILYYIIILACVNGCYFGINELYNAVSGTQSQIYIGVEPLLFGLFCVIADMIFIGVKDAAVYLVRKRKNKESAVNV